jgi:hypothetical protein
MKLETQFKRSKGGNIHFNFLSIHFGKGLFGITILGIMLSVNFSLN